MNEIKFLGLVCFVVFMCWLFIEKFTNRSNRGLQQKHGDTDGSSPLRANAVKASKSENNLKHATSEESDAPPASDDPDSPYYITKQQHRLNIMRAESILEKEVQRRITDKEDHNSSDDNAKKKIQSFIMKVFICLSSLILGVAGMFYSDTYFNGELSSFIAIGVIVIWFMVLRSSSVRQAKQDKEEFSRLSKLYFDKHIKNMR